MSATEHDEEHDEPLHQAPWVFFATVGTCFGFLTLMFFAKWATGSLDFLYLGIAGGFFLAFMIPAMMPRMHT